MPKAAPAQVSFNAGELSPRLEGRVDLAKYGNGCKTLENFLPQVQGPAIKRSGTRHVKEVKDSSAATRLIPFEFGTTQAYILEFSNFYCRVYKDSGGVLETATNIVSVAATSPIRLVTDAHGLSTGNQIYVSGSTIPGINSGYFHVTVINGTTIDLIGTTSNGAGGAGGTIAKVHEFATPYATAHLAALQFAQSADVLYIASPNYAPRKLSRTGHTSWTMTEIAFDAPPFAQENLDPDEYIVATAETGSVSLYSTGGRFTSSHVGSYVKIAETLEGTYPEWIPNANRNVGNVTSWENYRLGTAQFDDSPSENSYAHYQGRLYQCVEHYGGAHNGPTPPLHDNGIKYDGMWSWEFINPGYGWALITAVTDAYLATATVVRELGRTVFSPTRNISSVSNATPNVLTTSTNHGYADGDTVFVYNSLKAALNGQCFTINVTGATTFELDGTTASGAVGAQGIVVRVRKAVQGTTSADRERGQDTSRWAFGAFSPARGYPTSVAFFEDRLVWAGTSSDPQGIWASRTGRYEDHMYTDEDDGALFLLLNSQQVNKIEWLSAGVKLAAGTAGGEFVFSSGSDSAMTPGNAQAKQQSFYGSRSACAPLRVENVTLFVQRSGRKLIEFSFDDAQQGYIGADLTVLSHHVTLARITEMAWAQEPDRTVWAILDDGQLVAMTYDRGQEVVGWHRHELGGVFGSGAVVVESIAVIPHPDGDRDQIWMIVKRTVNGATRRDVEYFEETWVAGTAIADGFFVDAGATYSGASATTIYGLWHLIGQSVYACAAGIQQGPFTVSATGQITLTTAATKAQVGLAFTAALETMRFEAGAADGTSQGKTGRINKVAIRVEDTGPGLQYGTTNDPVSRVGDTALADAVLVTGDTPLLSWPAGHEQARRVSLRHAQVTPCTIVAIFPHANVED